jgi:hypothetical protein
MRTHEPNWSHFEEHVVAVLTDEADRLDEQNGTNLIHQIREYGTESEETGSWLGLYRPMRHGVPGNVILHARNLTLFFHRARVDLASGGHNFDWADEHNLASLIFWGTYAHEQFHFLCDAARRRGAGLSYDRLVEESLATAWSRVCILWLGQQLEASFAVDLAHWKFDSIVAPGYREWRNFKTMNDLRSAADHYAGLSHDYVWVPSGQIATWCNYWLGGDFPSGIADRVRGRRGTKGFFRGDMHREVLSSSGALY